jgi:fucose 4-O-acetylase-like acetyltransferase
MSTNIRNQNLDVMKGIGVSLVILSHSLGKNVIPVDNLFGNGLFNVICSFFMPMFFIISGYLVYNKLNDKQWLRLHITRWCYPLLSFTVIYWVFGTLFPNLQFNSLEGVAFINYILYTIQSGFSGLVIWFLFTMMLCYLLVWVLEQGRLKIRVPVWLQALVLIFVLNILPVNMLGLSVLKWYSIFFVIGYLIKHYLTNRVTLAYKCNILAYASLVLFPLAVYFTDWMKPYQDFDYGSFGSANIIPAITNNHALLIVLMFGMAILGSLFIYSLSRLVRWQPVIKVLTYLGKNTIGIYLLHPLFSGIFPNNEWVSALLSGIVAIVLYELLKRVKIFDKYLFGNEVKRLT